MNKRYTISPAQGEGYWIMDKGERDEHGPVIVHVTASYEDALAWVENAESGEID